MRKLVALIFVIMMLYIGTALAEPSAAQCIYILDQGAGSHSGGGDIGITHKGTQYNSSGNRKTMISNGCSLYATLHAFQWLTGYSVTDSNVADTIRLFLQDANGGPEVLDWYNANNGHSTAIDFLQREYGITPISVSSSNKAQLESLFSQGGVAKYYTPNGTHFAVAVGMIDADLDSDGTTETWIHIIDSAAYFSFGSTENMAWACRSFSSHSQLSLDGLAVNNVRNENNRSGLEYWMRFDLFKNCTVTYGLIPSSPVIPDNGVTLSYENTKYTVTNDFNLKRKPYSDSEMMGTCGVGDSISVKRVVLNSYNNVWLEASTGGYIFGGYKYENGVFTQSGTQYLRLKTDNPIITVNNPSMPSGNLPLGQGFEIQGTINSSNSIYSVNSEIYSGSTRIASSDTWYSGDRVTQSMSLLYSVVNTTLKFSKLSDGNYIFKLNVTYYYDRGTKTATKTIYTTSFTVGNAPADSTAPVISNIDVSNVTSSGYTVSCTVTDNIGVTEVKFPTWTEQNGQDDLIWHVGTISGNTATYTVRTSDHNNENGCTYITHIYAYDAAGNSTSAGTSAFVPAPDTTKPTISNVKVSNLTSEGYTVTCTVSDNVGVTKVQFPTWYAGQQGEDATWHDGTISGNKASCYIKVSDHDSKTGLYYHTDIYAWDAAGNMSEGANARYNFVPNPTVRVISITLDKSDLIMNIGTTYRLAATVLPSNATDKSLFWATNNSAACTVDDGVVSAVGAGTAIITCAANDGSGVSVTCNVTVNEPIPDFFLPAGLLEIDEEAFAGINAQRIMLPGGVQKISKRAFAGCTKLKYIYIPEATTQIAGDAFTGVASDFEIHGKYNSYARTYASQNGYTFIADDACTITFNANGGSCSTTSEMVNIGTAIATLPSATRSYYTFNGWYTASSGGTMITSSTTFSSDTTLFAHWTLNGFDNWSGWSTTAVSANENRQVETEQRNEQTGTKTTYSYSRYAWRGNYWNNVHYSETIARQQANYHEGFWQYLTLDYPLTQEPKNGYSDRYVSYYMEIPGATMTDIQSIWYNQSVGSEAVYSYVTYYRYRDRIQ